MDQTEPAKAPAEAPAPTGWRAAFNLRERQEIEFDAIYADRYAHGTDGHAHGTDGHNARLIIARMARILDQYETRLQRNRSNAGQATGR